MATTGINQPTPAKIAHLHAKHAKVHQSFAQVVPMAATYMNPNAKPLALKDSKMMPITNATNAMKAAQDAQSHQPTAHNALQDIIDHQQIVNSVSLTVHQELPPTQIIAFVSALIAVSLAQVQQLTALLARAQILFFTRIIV